MKNVTINHEEVTLTFDNLKDNGIRRAALEQLLMNGEKYMAFTDVDGVAHAILNDVTGATEEACMVEFNFHSGEFDERTDFIYPIEEYLKDMD